VDARLVKSFWLDFRALQLGGPRLTPTPFSVVLKLIPLKNPRRWCPPGNGSAHTRQLKAAGWVRPMNFRSRALWAVLGALHLTGTAFAIDLAFLGPKGSYSDEAANEYVTRAHLGGTTALTTISEIAQSVREGRAQFGLLPFENSTGGFVGETLSTRSGYWPSPRSPSSYRRITNWGLPVIGHYTIETIALA
jgi:hypothetical protein